MANPHSEAAAPPMAGVAHDLKVDLFTGSASLHIPLHLTACRGFIPSLALRWQLGDGNGPFGHGFSLDITSIRQAPLLGAPNYSDDGPYAYGPVGTLTRTLKNGRQRPVQTRTDNRKSYKVTRYVAAEEGAYQRIEKWVGTLTHWRVWTPDNICHIFGLSDKAQVADPIDDTHIYEWLLQRSFDARGNEIEYHYRKDAQDGSGSNRQIERIDYGRFADGSENWHFSLAFDYSKRTAKDFLKGTGTSDDIDRDDPYLDFCSGFERRTDRLCRNIMLSHCFEVGKPFLVHGVHLKYKLQDGQNLLRQVNQVGYRQGKSSLITAALPPLDLSYGGNADASEFTPLKQQGQEPGRSQYQISALLDMNGDGAPGLMQSDGMNSYYAGPAGHAKFQAPVLLDFLSTDSAQHLSLADIEGDGDLDLVYDDCNASGAFLKSGDDWQSFHAYDHSPTLAQSGLTQQVDLCGNGLADMVLVEPHQITLYENSGAAGYGPARMIPSPHALPNPATKAADEFVGFVDFIGDGGSHLARIRQGEVTLWPHLGQGQFGAPREMLNPPDFGGPLDPNRLILVDSTGSGSTCILYIRADGIHRFDNIGGIKFAKTKTKPIPIPGGWSALGTLRLADLTSSCRLGLMWSAPDTSQRLHHSHLSFVADDDVPAFALSSVDNAQGQTASIRYGASTGDALQDRKDGHPWEHAVPHSVNVVRMLETRDTLANTTLSDCYRYHDAAFNPMTRNFVGFSCVESWDTDAYTQSSTKDCLYKRSWFLTGATPSLTPRFGFFAGPAPISKIDPTIASDEAFGWRRLRGQLQRQEIYNGTSASAPLQLTSWGHLAKEIQPRLGDQPAVFACLPRETITAIHEGEAKDARLTHHLVLATDAFGHPTKTCDIAYPRASTKVEKDSGQDEICALLHSLQTGTAIDQDDTYLRALPVAERSYQIAPLPPKAGSVLAWDEILEQSKTTPKSTSLIQATRHYYWDKTGRKAVRADNPALGVQALPHHSQRAILTAELSKKTYGKRATAKLLKDEAHLEFDDKIWWNPGAIETHYRGKGQFFQTQIIKDGAGATTKLDYDPAYLVPTHSSDDEGHCVSVTLDPYTLSPAQVTDINGAISSTIFDPLGRVIATGHKGYENGQPVGSQLEATDFATAPPSFAKLISKPHNALKGAARRLFYYPGKPACMVEIVRETRTNKSDPLTVILNYYDGFGRVLQRKTMHDLCKDTELGDWRRAGLVELNREGLAQATFGPGLNEDAKYLPRQANWDDTPDRRMFYDPLGRMVRHLDSSGAETRVTRSAWSEFHENALDVDPTSPLHNTPEVHHLDPQGNVCKLTRGVTKTQKIHESYCRDILGQIISTTDAMGDRGLEQTYDLAGAVIHQIGPKTGERIILHGPSGGAIHTWDSRKIHLQHHYDKLHRLVGVEVEAQEPDGLQMVRTLAETRDYGADTTANRKANRVGRMVKLCDQAGVLEIKNYNIDGLLTETTRRHIRDTKNPINWARKSHVQLESSAQSLAHTYDALGRRLCTHYDHVITIEQTYGCAGEMATMTLAQSGHPDLPLVAQADYTPRGQSDTLMRGNKINSNYYYDEVTQKLSTMQIEQPDPSDGSYQAHDLFYDKLGNLVRIDDIKNDPIISSHFDYDGLNRLLKASTPDGTIAYSYDKIGNRIGTPDPLSSDRHGNKRKLASGADLHWDWADRLCRIDDPNGIGKTTQIYDGFGYLVRELVEAPDGTPISDRRMNEDLTNTRYGTLATQDLDLDVHIGTIPLARAHFPIADGTVSAGTLEWYLTDHLGSVTQRIKDVNAAPPPEICYSAFGKSQTVTTENGTLGYGGKPVDGHGISHYGARDYLADSGAWLSADPAGTVDGLNLFVFAQNNPITNVDYGGHVTGPGEMTLGMKSPRMRKGLRPSSAPARAAHASQAPERPQASNRRGGVIQQPEARVKVFWIEISHNTVGKLAYNDGFMNKGGRAITKKLFPDHADRINAIRDVNEVGNASLSGDALEHFDHAQLADKVALAASIVSQVPGAGLAGKVVGAVANGVASQQYTHVAETMETYAPAEVVYQFYMKAKAKSRRNGGIGTLGYGTEKLAKVASGISADQETIASLARIVSYGNGALVNGAKINSRPNLTAHEPTVAHPPAARDHNEEARPARPSEHASQRAAFPHPSPPMVKTIPVTYPSSRARPNTPQPHILQHGYLGMMPPPMPPSVTRTPLPETPAHKMHNAPKPAHHVPMALNPSKTKKTHHIAPFKH